MNEWTTLGWAVLLLVAFGLVWRERILIKNGKRMREDYLDEYAERQRHHLNMEEEAIRSSDVLERIAAAAESVIELAERAKKVACSGKQVAQLSRIGDALERTNEGNTGKQSIWSLLMFAQYENMTLRDQLAQQCECPTESEPVEVIGVTSSGLPITLGDELAVEGRGDDRETDFDLSADPDGPSAGGE